MAWSRSRKVVIAQPITRRKLSSWIHSYFIDLRLEECVGRLIFEWTIEALIPDGGEGICG